MNECKSTDLETNWLNQTYLKETSLTITGNIFRILFELLFDRETKWTGSQSAEPDQVWWIIHLDVVRAVQLGGSLLRQATGAVLQRGENRGGNVDVVTLRTDGHTHTQKHTRLSGGPTQF